MDGGTGGTGGTFTLPLDRNTCVTRTCIRALRVYKTKGVGGRGSIRSPQSPQWIGPHLPRKVGGIGHRHPLPYHGDMTAIPRLIHWWWDGPPLPDQFAGFRDRWKRMHPDWELVVWDEASFLDHLGDHPVVPFFRDRSRWSPRAHEWGWKTNLARYAILQREGGLWVDADLEPLKPVDPLIQRLEGSGLNAMAALEDDRFVNNAFLASQPGGEFITTLVRGLDHRIRGQRNQPSNVATGPHYLTSVSQTSPGLMILDRELIYPMHWSELDRRAEDFPAAYTLHHWHRKSTEQTSRAGQVLRDTQLASARPGVKPDRIKITAGSQPRGAVVSQPSAHPVRTRRDLSNMSIPHRIKKIKGLTPDNVMLALADMAASVPAQSAIVEVGTYHGRTALTMAWGANQGHGAHVWTVDPWDLPGPRGKTSQPDTQHPHRQLFTSPHTRNWARYHVRALGYGRYVTLVQDFSVQAAMTWTGPLVGLLFIDGDHDYESVREDVRAWTRHLADDAMIAFDDYTSEHPEVVRAVDDMVDEGILNPVQIFHDRLAVTGLTTGTLKPTTASEEDGCESSHVESGGAEGDISPATPEELPELEAVTPVDDLDDSTLRALIRARGIKLGRGRRSREQLLQALRGVT